MAQEQSGHEKSPARLLIRNIGLLLSGDLDRPILDADTVVVEGGKIPPSAKQEDVDGEARCDRC